MVTIQRLALLGLIIGARVVKAWDHVSPGELSRVISELDVPVLVACKKPDEPSSASFEEEWATATSHADEQAQIMLSIDCSTQPADCEVQPSMTYPSIFLLQQNKPPIQYLGPLLSDSFNHFLSRSTRSTLPLTTIANPDDLAKFKTSDETVFILYLSQPDQQILSAYEDLAQKYKFEFSFGTVIADNDLLETERVDTNGKGAVIAYKPLDGDTVKLDLSNLDFAESSKALEKLENSIKEASRPVITELSPWNHQRLIDLGKPTVYLFAPTAPQRNDLRKQFHRFARDYYHQFTSVLVDPFLFPDLMPQLGLLNTSSFPAGAVHILSENKIYPYPQGEKMTLGKVQGWGMRIWQGGVEPWVPGTRPVEKKKGEGKAQGGDGGGMKIQGKVGTKRKVTVGGWGKGKGKIPNIPGVKINIPGVGRDEL
ncbi:hypothetical protein B0T21DRAFT_330641 [Apiosordaria backusii]|uniref:Protein disulfide isomerase n=1 Tax=Apiosordaria backusii TaxID=314023 RepID=A0AA40EFY3_9PEZI|nr:hypothetical protein B0T21DRAFT_330641 [Apiosordaria backusii]